MNDLSIFYHQNKKAIEFALYQIREKGYAKKTISKKNGNPRLLSIPPEYVKNVQRIFNKQLQKLYTPPKPVHGFILANSKSKKNIITNASKHVKKNLVINVDLKDFFDTINFGRIRGLFLSKPFNVNNLIATKLAQLSCFENKLPQGAPTSPTLSNIICLKLDHQLIKVAKKHLFTYTRYADDITFSSYKKYTNNEISNILKDIQDVVENNGFKINTNKIRVQNSYQQQTVTGIKVNQQLNVGRKYVRQIKSMLFSWYTQGLEVATAIHFDKYNKQPNKYYGSKEQSFQNILLGKINFLGQVKGYDNHIYIKFRYTFFLLQDDFSLTKKFSEFETFTTNNPTRRQVLTIFSKIYNSTLVLTEGHTDIMYLKAALKYYKKENKFNSLKLRYCNASSASNIKLLHQALYSKSNDLRIINLRKCILTHVKNELDIAFIIDGDNEIMHYFENAYNMYFKYFVIAKDENGYIEKLFDKHIIIDIIKNQGYTIDENHESLQKSTKNSLKKYLKSPEVYDGDYHALPSTSYIAYENKTITKTRLAKHIIDRKDIKYEKFEKIFQCLEETSYQKKYIKQLCCDSIY